MASQTPAVLQDENLPIYRGKGITGVKADVPKPGKKGLQDRKALGDLPKAGRPPISIALKASISKEKSFGHGRETTKNAGNSSSLSDEEMKKCYEWAKEGIEETHFTGNDLHNLRTEQQEERVKRKVDKVMAALRKWNDIAFGIGIPMKEASSDAEDMMKIEVVPEVLPSTIGLLSNSDVEEFEDLLLEPELDGYPYVDHTFELKPEYQDSDVCCS